MIHMPNDIEMLHYTTKYPRFGTIFRVKSPCLMFQSTNIQIYQCNPPLLLISTARCLYHHIPQESFRPPTESFISWVYTYIHFSSFNSG